MLDLIAVRNIKPYIPYVNGSLEGISEKRKQKLISGVDIGIERNFLDDVLDEIDGNGENKKPKGSFVAPLWALAHAYAESDAAREILSFDIAKTATYIQFNQNENTASIIHQPLNNKDGILGFGAGFYYEKQHYGLALNLNTNQLPLKIISGLPLDDFIKSYQYAAQFLFLMNENQLYDFSNRIIGGVNQIINLSSEKEKGNIQLSFGAYKDHFDQYNFGVFDGSINDDIKERYITLKSTKHINKENKKEMAINLADNKTQDEFYH